MELRKVIRRMLLISLTIVLASVFVPAHIVFADDAVILGDCALMSIKQSILDEINEKYGTDFQIESVPEEHARSFDHAHIAEFTSFFTEIAQHMYEQNLHLTELEEQADAYVQVIPFQYNALPDRLFPLNHRNPFPQGYVVVGGSARVALSVNINTNRERITGLVLAAPQIIATSSNIRPTTGNVTSLHSFISQQDGREMTLRMNLPATFTFNGSTTTGTLQLYAFVRL